MKPRLISMLLTGLVLAVGLLIAVQISQNIRSTDVDVEPEMSETQINNLNKSTNPVIFKTVSEQDGRMTLSGSGPANASLSVESASGILKTFSSDEDGNWSTELKVSSTDISQIEIVYKEADQIKIRSDETVYRVPHQTASSGNISNEPALVMIAAPGGPTRVLQSPFRGMPTSGPLGFGPIDYDESGGVIFSGVSEQTGRVRIYANDVAIGETRSESDGRWFFIASETLPTAEYDIRAELIVDDEVVADIILPFKRLSKAVLRDQSDPSVYVEYTPYRWQVLRPLYGGGYQYTAIYAPDVISETTGE